MKIDKKKMVFNEGTSDEEARDMVIVDKESYDLKLITEEDVGKTIRIPKSPMYFTAEQWKEVERFIKNDGN